MALIKAPSTAATLLLALVVAAAAVSTTSTEEATDQPAAADWTWTAKGGNNGDRRHDGHHSSSRRHDHHGHHHSSRHYGRHPPLTGLTQCVTTCGTQVTSCFLECYKPVNRGDPVELPICLLNCTNNAMICANNCSDDIVV